MSRLTFGVLVSPTTFFLLLIFAFILVFSPLLLVTYVSEQLPTAIRPAFEILMNCFAVPGLVTCLYVKRFARSGYGGLIFWLYTSFYIFVTLLTWRRLIVEAFTLAHFSEAALGAIICGTMVYWAIRARKLYQKSLADTYAWQREEQVRIHTEAIVRARGA